MGTYILTYLHVFICRYCPRLCYTHIYIYIHTYTYICIYVRVCICMLCILYMYIYIYICIYIYIYISTYVHGLIWIFHYSALAFFAFVCTVVVLWSVSAADHSCYVTSFGFVMLYICILCRLFKPSHLLQQLPSALQGLLVAGPAVFLRGQ